MLQTTALMLVLTAASGGAAPAPGQSPPARPTNAGPNALEPTPLHVAAMGLTFNPPAGSVQEQKNVKGTPTMLLTDPATTPAWRLSIQPLFSTLDDPTAEKIAQQHMDDLKQGLKPGAKLPVISSAAVRYGNIDGWLFYLPLKAGAAAAEQDNPQSYVTGWLIMPTGPKTFLVFSSVVSEPQFPMVRPLLEASFATIKLEMIDQIDAQRKTMIETGKQLLATFTPARLSELLGQDQWFRVYKPGPNGDQEIGVYRLQVVQAKRGTLNPDRDERLFNSTEETLGFMVKVGTKQVVDSTKGVYVDALFSYWMTWDSSEEEWSQLSTVRQGEHEVSEHQTGVRTAGAKPNLTVVGGQTRNRTREEMSWDIPDAYLSQSLHWLLGELMPRDLTEPRDYCFYFYNSAKNDLVRRTDRWAPAPADSPVAGAAWVLSTTMGSDPEPTVTQFDDKGALLRQVRPNGSIVVPVIHQKIQQLWISKGLKWSNSP